MKLTITEALAEIKTISARLSKKKQFVLSYLIRQEMVKDPLESDGGTYKVLERENQSIKDLEKRVVNIREAIRKANLSTELTVLGVTDTVSNWLTWQKEVAPERQKYLANIRHAIETNRSSLRQKGAQVGGDNLKPTDFTVNLNEKALAEEIESMEELLGTLDGKLSLVNATTVVELT